MVQFTKKDLDFNNVEDEVMKKYLVELLLHVSLKRNTSVYQAV